MSGPRRSSHLAASSNTADTGQTSQPTSSKPQTSSRKPVSRARNPQSRGTTKTRPNRKCISPADQDEYNPHDDGSEGNDHYEPPKGRGSKKRKTAGGSSHSYAPPQKRRLWTDVLSEKGRPGVPAVPRSAIDVTITPQFTNTNKFLTLIEHGLRADPGSPQVYAPSSGDMPFVWNLEPLEDRDYVPVEDKLVLYNILRNGKQVQVWRLVVRDTMRPEEDDIWMFCLPGSRRNSSPQTNFLDLGLCPARDDALRLLQDACDSESCLPLSV